MSFIGTSTAVGKLVISRSLQLTVKKAGNSMKTLDGSIKLSKNGETTTMSQRVAEIDQMMPKYLGVSKAILESVIFCHQDESLWPMSEPATLKKKFDEIFEALKYTKAIANIKDLAKSKKTSLGQLTILAAGAKDAKDRAEKLEKKCRQLQTEIETLRAENNELQKDIDATEANAGRKRSDVLLLQNILGNLNLKRENASMMQRSIDSTLETMEEMTEPDEWLKSTLAQYQERLAHSISQQEIIHRQQQEAKQRLDHGRRQLNAKLAEQGQHEADKKKYERDLVIRNTLVKDSAELYKIRGFEGELDETEVRAFITRINKESRDKGRSLEVLQKRVDEDLSQKRDVREELQRQKAAHIQNKLHAKESITSTERKISKLQKDIDSISIDEGAKAVLESSLKSVVDRLQTARAELDSASWESQIQSETIELRRLDDEAERLSNELREAMQYVQAHTNLAYTRKELNETKQSLETMVSAHTDKINAMLGTEWSLSSLEEDYQVILEQKREVVAKAQRGRDSRNRELEEANFKLSSLRKSKDLKTKELKKCQEMVIKSIEVEGQPLSRAEDYIEELTQLQTDRDIVSTDFNNFESTAIFFKQCINVVKTQNKCHLCDRKFVQEQEKSAAIQALNNKLAKQAKETIEADLRIFDEALKVANAARPQYEVYTRLSQHELPELSSNIQEADKQRADVLSQLEVLDRQVNQLDMTRKDVEAIATTVATIVRYQKQAEKLESKLTDLASQQQSSGVSSRSVEEIQDRQNTCLEETKGLRARIEGMRQSQLRGEKGIAQLEYEKQTTENKLGMAEQRLSEKKSLSTQIRECKDNNTISRASIEAADQEMDKLAPKIAQVNAEYEEIKRRGDLEAKEVRSEQSKISNTLNKLESADGEVSHYLNSGGPAKLDACQSALVHIQSEMKSIEDEMTQLTDKLAEMKKQAADGDRIKRNIQDNLKYRRDLKELDKIRSDIEELESKNATQDYRRLQVELSKLETKLDGMRANRGTIQGGMKSKDNELAGLLEDYESMYKNAARDFRVAVVNVETTRAAIEDLTCYSKALDHAIMKYHGLKMEEINRIAGELWQATYQGTDIDTILINSDAENAAGKRTYNYRVCMIKQDAEMDMRGRCSAGQRVLASIIIRLALAECFGVNCGVSSLRYVSKTGLT